MSSVTLGVKFDVSNFISRTYYLTYLYFYFPYGNDTQNVELR